MIIQWTTGVGDLNQTYITGNLALNYLSNESGAADVSNAVAPDYKPKNRRSLYRVENKEPFEEALEVEKKKPILRLVKSVEVPEKQKAVEYVKVDRDVRRLMNYLEAEERERKLKKRIREQDLAFILKKILEL